VNAEEILEKARTSATPPHGWIVLPLSRVKVGFGIAGWCLGGLLGFGLFYIAARAVIPFNFQHGTVIAVCTTLLLAILLFIGIGSVWMIIQDTHRLLKAEKHIIVITPEHFVKQEGEKIVTVPLTHVRYVTAKGTPPPDRTVPKGPVIAQMPTAGERFSSLFMGQAVTREGSSNLRRRRRTPMSLAFVDARTEDEVIVVTDGAYGDPFMIAALLKQYAASVA